MSLADLVRQAYRPGDVSEVLGEVSQGVVDLAAFPRSFQLYRVFSVIYTFRMNSPTPRTVVNDPSLDIENRTRHLFPGCKTSILKEIGGGHSGAVVLLVDIDIDDAVTKATLGVQPGQYILKVQTPNPWPGETQESERHSEAASRNPEFGLAHIPVLRHSETVDGLLLLLYDIAGQSLASFVAADTVDAAALRHYCATAATDLWLKWNEAYSVNAATSARESLRRWLGYRLNPTKAEQLHDFVASECERRSVFRMADRVLVNPLFAASSACIDVPVARVSFDGMIHGDLHLGNILVDPTLRRKEQYWLIDFALAADAPLGFDQAYLELSILIGLLQGDPQRILNILEALDSADDLDSADEPEYVPRVPVEDVGIFNPCKDIRQANTRWQMSREPNRPDSVIAQRLLSRIAVGLNWANKPMTDSKRRLALAYAAWAATRYLERFNPDESRSLFTDYGPARQSLSPAVTPAWPEVWEQLGRFDSTKAKYVLVTERLDVSEELQSLASIPWSAIVDLDPWSNENGLHSAIGKTLAARRSVNQYGLKSIPIDADRGTAWFMAYGWPSRHEPEPQDFRLWRREYGEPYRRLLRELRREAAPLPVKVVILASGELDMRVLQSLIDMADESLETSSDITLIGLSLPENDPAVKARHIMAVPEFLRAVYQVFGASIQVDEPTVPSSDGQASLPLDQLRSLEEDLEILHSNILKQPSRSDGVTDAFWRGNPPSWSDLHADVDVRRGLGPQLLKKVGGSLRERGNHTIELRHAPGSGGTTAALRCGWDLRRDFPVAVLRQYSTTTADRIDQLFRISQKPVLLIAEAALLPQTNREDLYREIAKRNARCVILYVVRTFGEKIAGGAEANPLADRLEITDPMADGEALEFLSAFSARTTNLERQELLRELAKSEQWKPYRSPFFFGLTTYEEEFESVHSYVEHHLSVTLTEPIKKAVRFLALVTRYSQTGISKGLLNQFLGLDPASDIEISDAFGDVISRLIIRREQAVRLLHPVIAQEILSQSLGDTDWKYGLKDLALEFIAETTDHLGSDAAETLHLFTELFIRRDHWTSSAGRRPNFSEILLDIPSLAGQHKVLLALTDACPQEAHFWNHLGRHQFYEMKQNFPEAEQHLIKAVELNPNEPVHHHSLGMVRRFWIRSLMGDMLRREPPPTAEQMLEEVHALFTGAADEFAIVRELSPESDHGYITHIQLILEVLEGLVRLGPDKSLRALLGRTDTIGNWVRESIVVAEDLLSQVRQLRGRDAPSRHELTVETRLATLYGHFDAVISSLENLSNSSHDPDVRRALAAAYFSKRGRRWAQLPAPELRRTKDLMEDNLRTDPTNARDIRSWFQAFRRLPEFSYIDAIDRLNSWAQVSNQADAYYYLYILHFLRWRQGAEGDEGAMRANLEQCRQRSIGKRGYSYEWLAKEPDWCPLAHASELGDWERDRNDDFWENTEPLEWVRGSIASIKGPQAGTIRLGPQTEAFFVPRSKFSKTRHLNSLVKFYIGFSYEGLRAWETDFLSEDAVTTVGERIETQRKVDNAARLGSVTEQTDVKDKRVDGQGAPPEGLVPQHPSKMPPDILKEAIRAEVLNLLSYAERNGRNLPLVDLGPKLSKRFGRTPPPYRKLGYANLTKLVKSYDEFDVDTARNVIRTSPR